MERLIEKLGDTPTGWAEDGPIGKTKLYEAMNSRALKAHKNGAHTIILTEDYLAYLKSLPEYEPDNPA
jgi:hypothetical protein